MIRCLSIDNSPLVSVMVPPLEKLIVSPGAALDWITMFAPWMEINGAPLCSLTFRLGSGASAKVETSVMAIEIAAKSRNFKSPSS